jgi:hypothetical protein
MLQGKRGQLMATTITARTPAGTTGPPAAREGAPWRTRVPPILLGCGIISGALYFIGDVLMSVAYPGYSYLDQTVSELNAFGAPTRGLSIAFGLAGNLLLIPFGAGIWRTAAGSRRLRVVGGAVAALGVAGLWGVPFASMQPRGTAQPASHAISAVVGLLLLATAMGFAASASGRRLRLYSIATIVAMLAFGGWSAMYAGRAQAGLATPWVGGIERVSFYSWHLWFIVLALTLLRQRPRSGAEQGVGDEMPTNASMRTGVAPTR